MKLLAKIIIIVAIFFGGFYFGQQQALSPSNGSSTGEQTEEGILVSLMLDLGNGEVKTYNNISLPDDKTVFSLLEEITSENDIEFTYKDYGGELGVFVESINEIKNDFGGDKFWQYWVNNEYAQIGPSQYILDEDDVVEWKYVKGQID